MKRIALRLIDLIRKGEILFMIKGISKRIYSKTKAFGLKRDLDIDFPIPDAKIPISIRVIKDEDELYFFADLQNDGLEEKDIKTCYVAVDKDDRPLFKQWLIGPEYKDVVKEFWGPAFPELKSNEMLLENGFTIPSMRRQGIMPAAITRIIDQEKRNDIRYVITFVGIDNIASLKGIYRSGFLPYTLRTEHWFLLKRTVTFEDVSESMMKYYWSSVGR